MQNNPLTQLLTVDSDSGSSSALIFGAFHSPQSLLWDFWNISESSGRDGMKRTNRVNVELKNIQNS